MSLLTMWPVAGFMSIGDGVAALDTQNVTVGGGGSTPNRTRGFSTVGGYGAIVDGTSDIFAGAAITELAWDEGGGGTATVILKITGATNTGWTTMTVGSTPFTRASASSFAGGQWTWNGAGNPFGGVGGNVVSF
jgi:hypothetical protein